jgi:hypothetical protein
MLQARDSSSGCGAITINLDWAVKEGAFTDTAFFLRDRKVEGHLNYL